MNRPSPNTIDSLPSGCLPECPGCAHKFLTHAQSLAQKERWLKTRLSAWAPVFEPIRAVDEPARWSYRGKVCLSARWERGKWNLGLIKNKTVIPIHDCPIHNPMVNHAVSLLSASLPNDVAFPLAYFAQTGSQITLVVKSSQMPNLEWLDEALTRKLECLGISGLWLHLHPCAGKKVFAKNAWHLLFGSPRSFDENRITYGPRAFQQLIPALYEQVLTTVETFLAPAAQDMIIDLYCGTGTGLARWQQQCLHVTGVESDGEAVACARNNAVRARVLRGRCADRIPQLIEWTGALPSDNDRLLHVNPPRTGLEPEVLDWITGNYRPDRMAYLSCSAGTLQKDLTRLEASGYQVIRIMPYDFFPQTLHVECLVFLQSEGH